MASRPIATQFPGAINYLTIECSFDLQATWVIDELGLIFGMISMGVYTTRYLQMSGRLVEELNVLYEEPGRLDDEL